MKYIEQLFQRAPPVNKPWLLLQRVRTFFENELHCSTAELLRSHLLPFFKAKIRPDVMIGYAHVSGNLYLGMGAGNMTPAQALVANLFTHGEIGVDYLCTTGAPQFTKEDELLLSQLATFKVLRVDDGSEIKARASRTKEATINLDGTDEPVKKKRQEKGFRGFPFAKTLFTHPIEGSGNLLQHDAYLDNSWELQGETEDEWLVSLAKHMQYQSYPSAEDNVGVCAVYMGKLFSGSTIPAVSSIQMLGASMLANGVHPSQIEKVCFAGKVDERIRLWNPNAAVYTVEELQAR
eukprot:GEMP01028598.1.p1 GENE.GEMP01028598.1~~GEMP01028598.1.p1  ORF type:complete len:292 (+),score=54.99 GEMP01028598.1:51-926(+)